MTPTAREYRHLFFPLFIELSVDAEEAADVAEDAALVALVEALLSLVEALDAEVDASDGFDVCALNS